MPVDRIESLPEYTQAFVDHNVALREAGADDVKKLEAMYAWSEKQRELDRLMVTRNDSERQFGEAKAKIAAEYKDVPESIYAGAASPEAMLASAKAFQEALDARAPQLPAGTPPAPTGTGGQPPTGAGQVPPPQNDVETLYREAANGITSNMGNVGARRTAVDRLMTVGINGIVGPAMRNAKNDASRSGAR